MLRTLLPVVVSVVVAAQEHEAHTVHEGHNERQHVVGESFNKNIETDFELLDSQGKIRQMHDYQGEYVLLTFGFTHCRHICPMTAANIRMALNRTEKKSIGIFVSVDTERDTPQITHNYTQAFHKNMTGLSGSHGQVVKAAKNFKVSFAVTKTQDSYTVQHTSHIYLIDPGGQLLEIFPFNTSPEKIAGVINAHDK